MDRIIQDRRELHRIPELDRDLERTFGYLRAALRRLRCRVFAPEPGSLCAYFDNGAERTLAFRSGADALPVQERSFTDYSSRISGHMHACGHDGHMAMLLELARRMQRRNAPCNILLIFQSAEETTGGARDVCKTGVFESFNVEAIFALQLMPGLECGKFFTRPGEMMSRSCELHMELEGRACGVNSLSRGIDALSAGVEYYGRARAISTGRDVLLHFGRMVSGYGCNVVSDMTRLEATLRSYNDASFGEVLSELEALGDEIAGATGCSFRMDRSMGYPPVMNPPELLDRLRACGLHFETLDAPVLLSEDFSWYQKHLSGAFFFLGVGPGPELQAEDFNFDEAVLKTGADFWEALAMGYR